MANTLKLGNSNWATKESSLLAYNDENDNFKPLPFTTTRASASSRINKLGLIENVGNNIATIDYQGNVNGALLTQPQSTNLITYPVSFGNSYWTKSGASIEGDASTAGSELVTNGDFATDTDWTKSADWTISGGSAHADGTGTGSITQSIPFEDGKTYKITFDVTARTQGSVRLFVDLPTFKQLINTSDIGTHTVTVSVEGGSQTLYFYSTNNFNGSIDNVSVKEVQGFTSPSADYPTSAYKLVFSGVSEILRGISFTIGEDYTFSFWAKTESGTFDFTLGNMSFVNVPFTATNEWQRFEVTQSAVATTRFPKIASSIAGELLIFGAQLEALSYPTSLIYNGVEGSTVTRVADQVTDSGDVNDFNSTEGVLYVEMAALANDGTNRFISLTDGISFANGSVELYYTPTSNQLRYNYRTAGNILQCDLTYAVTDVTISNKIAVVWNTNRFELWANGSKLVEDTVGITNIAGTFTELSFDRINALNLYAKTKDVRVFSTALSDAELILLTS